MLKAHMTTVIYGKIVLNATDVKSDVTLLCVAATVLFGNSLSNSLLRSLNRRRRKFATFMYVTRRSGIMRRAGRIPMWQHEIMGPVLSLQIKSKTQVQHQKTYERSRLGKDDRVSLVSANYTRKYTRSEVTAASNHIRSAQPTRFFLKGT